jgi:hypothetical protein
MNVKKFSLELVRVGVDLSYNVVPINGLKIGQRNVCLQGTIDSIKGPRPWKDKQGWVGTIILRDDTGIMRIILFNKCVLAISNHHLQVKGVVRISGLSIKAGRTEPIEAHTGNHSAILKVYSNKQTEQYQEEDWDDEFEDFLDDVDESTWRESYKEIEEAVLKDMGYGADPEDEEWSRDDQDYD